MKDELVLCVRKDSLKPRVKDIPSTAWAYLNRAIVDSKDELSIAQDFVQFIPVIVLRNQGKYLTYTRKGSEERLHKLRTFNFGGHVTFEDALYTVFQDSSIESRQQNIAYSIVTALSRELEEEVGITLKLSPEDALNTLSDVFYSPADEVSSVHAGVYLIFEGNFTDEESLKELVDSLEIDDPQWMTLEEIKASNYSWEHWAEIIYKDLVNSGEQS